MDMIEANKAKSRFPIESINSAIHSHQVPQNITLDNGVELNDLNDAQNPGQASIEKFIQLNVHNENTKNYHDGPKYGGFWNKPHRIIHRRRKRGSNRPLPGGR